MSTTITIVELFLEEDLLSRVTAEGFILAS